MLEVGQVFLDKYKIDRVLGKGGMGTVYLATHITLGNKWAIKETKKQDNINLLAEKVILTKLNHSKIPRIVDIYEDKDYMCIVEDYFQGKNLSSILREKTIIEEQQVISWSLELCDILIYLHNIKPNSIIYKDLKPDNIIIDGDNKVKLVDFGISREYKPNKQNDTENWGSLGYTDIEVLGQSDFKSDIYSLGAAMHHILTGIKPVGGYEKQPVRESNKNISLGLEKIVAKCVNRKRENRYDTVEEVKKDLENIKFITSQEYKKLKAKKIKIGVFALVFVLCTSVVLLGFNIQSKNNKVRYLIKSGDDYLLQNNYDNAIDNFNKALKIRPKELKIYEKLCSVYNSEQDYDEIFQVIQNIRDKDFELSDKLYLYYGTAVMENKKYEEARNLFEKAVTLNENNIEAKGNIAICYAYENNKSMALKTLSEITANNNTDPYFTYIEGKILLSTGDYTVSEEKLRQAIKENPQDVNKLLDLSKVLSKQGKEEEIDILNNIINISPNNVNGITRIGTYYFNKAIKENNEDNKNQYLNESLKYFKMNESLGVKSIENIINMGQIYDIQKNFDKAIEYFASAAELSPKNPLPIRWLGDVFMDKKDYGKAKEYYNKVESITQSGEDFNCVEKRLQELNESGY